MNAPRIKLPRRPEAAPDLARYITVDDVARVTQLPPSSAYRVLHLVAERAGLDVSRASRGTRALRLPLAAWEAHAAAVLAPEAAPTTHPPPPRASTPARPSRAARRGPPVASELPGLPTTSARRRRAA